MFEITEPRRHFYLKPLRLNSYLPSFSKSMLQLLHWATHNVTRQIPLVKEYGAMIPSPCYLLQSIQHDTQWSWRQVPCMWAVVQVEHQCSKVFISLTNHPVCENCGQQSVTLWICIRRFNQAHVHHGRSTPFMLTQGFQSPCSKTGKMSVC